MRGLSEAVQAPEALPHTPPEVKVRQSNTGTTATAAATTAATTSGTRSISVRDHTPRDPRGPERAESRANPRAYSRHGQSEAIAPLHQREATEGK